MNTFCTYGALCLAAVATATGPVLADGRATIESPTPEGVKAMEVSWNGDGAVRFDPGTADTYMLVLDDVLYALTSAGGMGPQVVNLSSTMGMAAGADSGSGLGAEVMRRRAEAVLAIEPTGRAEMLAGMEGELYEITWRNAQGESHTDNAVLSDAPLLRELDRARFALSEVTPQGEPDPRLIAVRDRGVAFLRYGDSYTVLSASDEARPAGAFELPGEALDVGNMLDNMGR